MNSDIAMRTIKHLFPLHVRDQVQKVLDELQEDSFDAGYQEAISSYGLSDEDRTESPT